MSDELEYTPAIAGCRSMGRLGQFMPGIRFEADPGMGAGAGGGDGGGGDAAAAGPALAGGDGADPAADAGAGAAAPSAPQPHWDDDHVADLATAQAERLFNERMAPLVPLLEQLFGEGDGAAGAKAAPGPLNPWADDYADNLDARFARMEEMLNTGLERLVQPLMERQQQEVVQEGEQRLQDMLHADIALNGDFPREPGATESKAEKLVMPLARMLFPNVAERFGQTPRAADLAVQRAAGMVREIVAEARAAALNQDANRLNALAGAHGEPGTAAVGAHGVAEIRARSIDEGLSQVTERYGAAIRAGQQ